MINTSPQNTPIDDKLFFEIDPKLLITILDS